MYGGEVCYSGYICAGQVCMAIQLAASMVGGFGIEAGLDCHMIPGAQHQMQGNSFGVVAVVMLQPRASEDHMQWQTSQGLMCTAECQYMWSVVLG